MWFYRSQTAENVIETYRRAVGEYGVPKEMLTDNGRQYTNWRGTTRFEKELKKAGLRDKFKTIVGGAPVTARWATKIGADAYAEDAQDSVVKIKELIG